MIKFAHINLVSKDYKKLAKFYIDTLGCTPVLPERDLKGRWLDKATGIKDAHIKGVHLRMPGYGEEGPTLEIFQYQDQDSSVNKKLNTNGFSHIAFQVEDVAKTAQAMLNEGGTDIGEYSEVDIEDVGRLIFMYIKDPEGNIVELQKWIK